MNKSKSFLAATLLFSSLGLGMVSCDKDDDNNEPPVTDVSGNGTGGLASPTHTFPTYLPTVYAGAKVEYNSARQVSRITDGDKSVTFDYTYAPRTRATGQPDEAIMTVAERGEQPQIFFLKLNSKGFATTVKQALGAVSSTEFKTWSLAYNDIDQLTFVKKGNEKTMEATYVNADLTEVKTKYLYGNMDSVVTSISYTSSSVPIVPNVSKVMLFDETMGFDLDDLEYAYIAGMLGTGTNNLPLSSVDSKSPADIEKYSWTTDDNFLVTSMAEDGETPVSFVWKSEK